MFPSTDRDRFSNGMTSIAFSHAMWRLYVCLIQKRCRNDFSVELEVPIKLEVDQDYKEKREVKRSL